MENFNAVDHTDDLQARQIQIDKLNRQIEEQQKKEKSGWFGLIIAALVALAIRALIFEPYNIPSSSMVPTLLVGDYLFITKFDYGYSKHSFPFSIPLIPRGRLFYVQPERGDVVIFKEPLQNKTDYIKRVIGIPGDTVQMKNGQLYINGQIVSREYKGQEYWDTEKVGKQLYIRYTETLPNGVTHDIYELFDNATYDETELVEVPEGYFFVMGDNRDNSSYVALSNNS